MMIIQLKPQESVSDLLIRRTLVRHWNVKWFTHQQRLKSWFHSTGRSRTMITFT